MQAMEHAVTQPLSLLNFHVDETPKAAAIDHPSTTLGRRPDFRILTDAYVRYPHEPEPNSNCLAWSMGEETLITATLAVVVAPGGRSYVSKV